MEEAREVERGAVEEEEDEAAAAAARVAVEMVLVVISSEGDRSSPCKECEGGGQDKEARTREIPASSSAAAPEAPAVEAVLVKASDSSARQATVFCWGSTA